MEFKGTRRNWGIDSENNVIDYLGDEIAFCPEWRTTSKANALLISKSPEMLKMLQECYKYLPYEGVMRKKVDKLIKQATEL